ncbi:MAG: DUF1640 domain-containing protein [Magnetococcales bacterium]|nr:DUF1640 domain-containing protein [Magnetococcales bacterium]
MPQAIAFDTLAFTKKMKSAGFTEQQAEAQAEAIAELVEDRLATKLDIELIRRDIKDLEGRLTIRLGIMLAWSTGLIIVVLGAMIKLL